MPYQPCFPMVVKTNGDLPDFSSLDTTRFEQLALGGASSGGMLITGDRLLSGSSYKLLDGSGAVSAGQGSFVQMVPWATYPAQSQLNLYYETQNSGTISASGRQSVYSTAVPANNGVHLLDVSDVGASGNL